MIGRLTSFVFRLLMSAYPADFRREFGDELLDTFERACVSLRRSQGLRAVSAFAVNSYLDTLVCAFAEHRQGQGKGAPVGSSASIRRRGASSGAKHGSRRSGPRRGRANALLSDLSADLRFSWRSMRRSPGFSAVAVLSVALGIGGNAAIFSIVDGVALRALPVPDADRLVHVWRENIDVGILRQPMGVPLTDLVRWRDRSRSLVDMQGYVADRVEVTGGAAPEEADALWVSEGFLDLMGLRITAGRAFSASDLAAGVPVAVVDERLARRRFGTPEPLGRILNIDGVAHVIVGIVAGAFTYPTATRIWRSLDAYPPSVRAPGLGVIGKLAPGSTVAEAEVELDAIAESLARETPEADRGWRAWTEPLHRRVVGDAGDSLMLLLAAVGFVLVIACANVANLLLVRATARRREIAVRAALGAGRARLARQLFVESSVLAVFGGATGVLAAAWGLESLLLLAPPELPRLQEVALDGRVLAFSLALTAMTSAAFGMVPALRGSRVHGPSLRSSGAAAATRRFGWRDGFVVVQIALGMLLMLGAGLLLNSFVRLVRVDPGFDPHGVLRARIDLPEHRYEDGDPANLEFYRDVLERLASAPGVRHTALGSNVPMSAAKMVAGIELEGRSIDREEVPTGIFGGSDEPLAAVEVQVVTPGYFPLFDIEIVQGRGLTERDASPVDQVGVVNETMAAILWPGERAIGKRLRFSQGSSDAQVEPWIRIVGVGADFKQAGLDTAVAPQITLPIDQAPAWAAAFPSMNLLLEGGDVATLAASLQDAVWAVDPQLPIPRIETMDELVARSVAGPRFLMSILTGFAAAALLLAALGLYGVMAFSVAERTFEIGVRKALGATAPDVVGQVVGRAGLLIAIGLSVGMSAGLALGRYMASILFEVAPTDAPTFVTSAGVFVVVALLASYLPARRAVAIDPVETLRRM